jgi:choline dehydrogenase-like flavoprotein
MENNNRLQNHLHGVEGPLLVSDPGHVDAISRWFVQTVQEKGEPFNHDFNGETQRGVGFYQFMNRSGKRSSAAYAYLAPLAKDSRITVKLRSKVNKINIENGRARSVTYVDKAGVQKTAYSNSDIILAAGALISPKLLMLSGLGPADHLASHGINPIRDLPGIGQNLIDHPEVPVLSLANGPFGYYKQAKGWRMLRNGLQFLLFGSGPITTTGFEAGAFINPTDPDQPPSIQAFCVPAVYLDRDLLQVFDEDYGVTITTVLMKPRSRGTVALQSSDPNDMPLVSPNLLKDPRDMNIMIDGQRYFRDVLQSGQLGKRIKTIIAPAEPDLSDEAMAAHCRKFVKTNYHPSGTARMGAHDDPLAVLDSRLAVRGIENLRVCDMSAVPNITAGNTNAAAMMLGDRCADFIMGTA